MRLANGFDARHCIYLGSIIHSLDAPSQWVWCSALASVSSSRPPLCRNLLLPQFCCLIRLCKLQVMACPRDFHYHFCVADWRALRPGSYPSSIEQKKKHLMVVDLGRSRSVSSHVYQDFMNCHLPPDLAGSLNTLPVPISRKDCPFKTRFVFAYGVDNSDKPSYCGPSEELMDSSCLSIRGLVITLTWRRLSSWSQLDSNTSLMLFLLIGNVHWKLMLLLHCVSHWMRSLIHWSSNRTEPIDLNSHRSGPLLSHQQNERRLLK